MCSMRNKSPLSSKREEGSCMVATGVFPTIRALLTGERHVIYNCFKSKEYKEL